MVGIVCVALTMLGEDIDNLLSDGGDGTDGTQIRFVPKHPQKLQMCWMHIKKKIHLLRRGPGIQNAPFTTRLMRWQAAEFLTAAGVGVRGESSDIKVEKLFAMMDSIGLTEDEVRVQSVAVKLLYCWVAAGLVQLEMIAASVFYDRLDASLD